MYQIIGETISVIGIYGKQSFQPKKFLWQKREYPITKVTFITDLRDGTTQKRRYSVTSGPQSYRLLFNRKEETWVLEELWVE